MSYQVSVVKKTDSADRAVRQAMELLGKPLGMFERDGEEAQEGVTIVDDV